MQRRWLWLLLIGAVQACAEDVADPAVETVPEEDLTFVAFSDDVLPLVTQSASFWAVAGENRELVIRYQPEEPGEEGDRFLEFKVPGNGLLRRPDGTSFARGDSILISVGVDDAGRFLFTFEPSGLEFDPEHPAELRIRYERADRDLDGDGDEDENDLAVERRLTLWKQEAPDLPWVRLSTVRVEELDEARADIFSFTGFALASN